MAILPFRPIALAALVLGTPAALAQNTPGNGWNSAWSFGSTADRSLGLSTAQAQRTARNGSTPGTVVYNTTDNRANYVEYGSTDGSTVTTEFQVGSNSTSTNTVGAMNTGATTITVEGSGNTVTANSAADSTGCLDGTVTTNLAQGPVTAGAGSYSIATSTAPSSCN